MERPNILLIMTDEERYAPPYEPEAVRSFRRSQLTSRESIRSRSLEFHRHYAGSTACVPSRATLFTGQYPSLHGVTSTDGVAKQNTDPGMQWLDPNTVPTLGDWFRAGGYRTHYRGKWHVSFADLTTPGSHEGLKASDDDGIPIPEAVDAYRKADRLDPFGFSGWIGREPHGADKSDCGTVRDGVFAEQVVELFGDLAASRAEGPWLTVASFVNPHDIAFSGFGWEQILQFGPPDDTVPEVPEAPSQSDSFVGRPACQEMFKAVWPQMIFETATDVGYRKLYYYLLKLVDKAIGRILEALTQSGMADETVVVFTSDHGDLLGAHGGLIQKWCNAFDEATRVPLLIAGPGIEPGHGGIQVPTSHVDLIPTLLGLAGIDPERATAGVAAHHDEVQPLPGRDLSPVIRGQVEPNSVVSPIYFMTEDDVTRGLTQTNILTGAPFDPVAPPINIESVLSMLPTGDGGVPELWKLNHYYQRLDDWYAAQGVLPNPFLPPAVESDWELHNLTVDPEERRNRAGDEPVALSKMQAVLEAERDAKRRIPKLRNVTK
jgi:arylsulfatase A-like enzyme